MTSNNSAPAREWYVVYTKPRSEKKLHEALRKKAITSYLPLLRIRKKWSDRYRWIEKPAFDSYLFVSIDFDQEALNVLKTPNAMRFVQWGGSPATLTQHDMDMLRISVEHFADSLIIRDASFFTPGETVLIKVGPFAGKEAIIERIQGKTLVLVNFPALNKTLQVEIPVENLQSPADRLV